MVRNRLGLIGITLFIGLLMLITACQQGTNNPSGEKTHGESVRVFSGQLDGYQVGEADIYAYDLFSDYRFLAGSIETGGQFNMDLQRSIAATHLITIDFLADFIGFHEICNLEDFSITNRDAGAFIVMEFIVEKEANSGRGWLVQQGPGGDLGFGDFWVIRVYVEKDIAVKGTCSVEDATLSVDMNFKQGWNLLTLTFTGDDENGVLTGLDLRTRVEPDNATWHFFGSDSFDKYIYYVDIYPYMATIEVGDTIALTATVSGQNLEDVDQAVTWSSSEPLVAMVDSNGVVTGINVGTVTITATSVFDSTKSASSTVTVSDFDTAFSDTSTVMIEREPVLVKPAVVNGAVF